MGTSLPLIKSGNTTIDLFMTRLKTELDPILVNPLINGILIPNVSLNSGQTTINHRLSRQMQGWIIVDVNQSVQIFRSAPLNDKTLTLTSSGACTVSLLVF